MKYFAAFFTLALSITPALAHEHTSTDANKTAMEKMHQNMDIQYTGDADKDFARGMIPHHEGAIDMAKTELKFGKDPELRKLAEDIITAQEKEIKQLKNWQAIHDKTVNQSGK